LITKTTVPITAAREARPNRIKTTAIATDIAKHL